MLNWTEDYLTWKAQDLRDDYIKTEQEWNEFAELLNSTAQRFLEDLETSRLNAEDPEGYDAYVRSQGGIEQLLADEISIRRELRELSELFREQDEE